MEAGGPPDALLAAGESGYDYRVVRRDRGGRWLVRRTRVGGRGGAVRRRVAAVLQSGAPAAGWGTSSVAVALADVPAHALTATMM